MVPLIYDHQDKIYTDGGLYFNALRHLEEIGLISFQPIAGYARQHLSQRVTIAFYRYGQAKS